MKNLRKKNLFYLPAILVAAGLLCLSVHDLIHVKDSSHISDRTEFPDEKTPLPEECPLCIISALGFAEPEDSQFIAILTGNQQAESLSAAVQTKDFFSNRAQRAPPAS